jgi:hypothetical protein
VTNPTRITVSLAPVAMKALRDAAQLNEESHTDVINRAIQLYALWSMVVAEGGTFLVEREDGRTASIRLS